MYMKQSYYKQIFWNWNNQTVQTQLFKWKRRQAKYENIVHVVTCILQKYGNGNKLDMK